MKSPNLEALAKVIPHLNRVGIPYAFLGGSIVELLITESPVPSIRPTKDVDAIIVATTYAKFAALEEQLRAEGFKHDHSERAPICRWIIEGVKVDLMPSEETILGMKSRWFREAVETAIAIPMEGALVAKVIAAPYFLATKIEAFRDRGKGDFIMSTDLEDIVAVVNGRPELADEIAQVAPDLRDYLITAVKEFLSNPDFNEALSGHLPPDQSNQKRSIILTQRLQAIARCSC